LSDKMVAALGPGYASARRQLRLAGASGLPTAAAASFPVCCTILAIRSTLDSATSSGCRARGSSGPAHRIVVSPSCGSPRVPGKRPPPRQHVPRRPPPCGHRGKKAPSARAAAVAEHGLARVRALGNRRAGLRSGPDVPAVSPRSTPGRVHRCALGASKAEPCVRAPSPHGRWLRRRRCLGGGYSHVCRR